MKILLHHDLLVAFLRQDLPNKTHQQQLKKMLENENSAFLYSKKFLTFETQNWLSKCDEYREFR